MKWIQGLTVAAGLSMGNFLWQYFAASPDYGRAALESYENLIGILAFIVIAL